MKKRLTILVVDDLDQKREIITSSLKRLLKHYELVVDTADRYEAARDSLRTKNYDFVILDIKIPAGGEVASEKWSRQLLREILEGNLCFPMHVFGLTQHSDIVEAEKQYYESNMFGFFLFDWTKDEWARAIAGKVEYLALAMQNGASYQLNSYDYDLLILAARYKNEYAPIKEHLFGRQRGMGHPLWPKMGHFGQLSLGHNLRLRAALICIGETGLAPAASVTTQAIQILRPRLVVMLGMCAGFKSKNVKDMDILVARESACWQEGKSIEDERGVNKFDPRAKYKGWSADLGAQIAGLIERQESTLTSALEDLSRSKAYLDLKKSIPSLPGLPSVQSGLIVSGSEVVASEEVANEVLRRHPTALGLEMEIFGVYTASGRALGKRPEFVGIKGVADAGDKDKKDELQAMASTLSAEVMRVMLLQWFGDSLIG